MNATSVKDDTPRPQVQATPELWAFVRALYGPVVATTPVVLNPPASCGATTHLPAVPPGGWQPGMNREVLAKLAGMEAMMGRIESNLEAVARGNYELRKENEELRQLNKDGYFNFAVRVDGDDFLAFAVIMALGNRKAAAEHLKIPARTFFSRVDQWAKRGRDYQLMCRYLEWRKRSSRHLKVELNPSLQSGDSAGQTENPDTLADVLTEIQAAADNTSYPALLTDVLQALERQNAGNWQAVREELISIIKEDLSQ